MRVVRNTPHQLVLQKSSWALSGFLGLTALTFLVVGLISFLMGDIWFGAIISLLGPVLFGGLFVYYIHRDDLILDKVEQTVEVRNATLFRKRRVRHELEHLKEAVIQTEMATVNLNPGSNMPQITTGNPHHRVALVLDGGMDEGTHPVNRFHTGGDVPRIPQT